MPTATPATPATPAAAAAAPRRWRRILIGSLAALVLLPVLAIAAGIARMWPDPVSGFEARRGRIASIERGSSARGALVREDLRVVSSSGLAVEVAVLRPAGAGRYPLLVLLAGHKTGKDAVDLFEDIGETAVAAISYPYAGEHRFGLLDAPVAIPRVQSALLDTTPAVMLALDALELEPYVDPQHVELVGVSLGAMLGPRIAALDGRFRRVWLVHGAGDIAGILAHQMRNRIDTEGLRRLVARGFAALAGAQHFAPEEWVARISPRSLVLVNALADERMPRACVDALHAGAREPHEVIWLEGGHVRTARLEIVRELVGLVLDRIELDRVALPALQR